MKWASLLSPGTFILSIFLCTTGFSEKSSREAIADKGIFDPPEEATLPGEHKDVFPETDQNFVPKAEGNDKKQSRDPASSNKQQQQKKTPQKQQPKNNEK